ncbi:unnamed protein product [Polarella glacialis]|uniref:EF-hand domain-containing protein n=1 Tax=Polarella glacialis TaxID=89957 RepID=A0A813FL88_POLGL|nr:unnamed protein product [Polarella glacialis]
MKKAPEVLGLSSRECAELWEKNDKNGDGRLSREEAKKMLFAIDANAFKAKKEQIAKLDAAIQDSATVDKLLDAFDITRDGKVSKAEFLQKAMEGYDVTGEPPSKKAKTDTE